MRAIVMKKGECFRIKWRSRDCSHGCPRGIPIRRKRVKPLSKIAAENIQGNADIAAFGNLTGQAWSGANCDIPWSLALALPPENYRIPVVLPPGMPKFGLRHVIHFHDINTGGLVKRRLDKGATRMRVAPLPCGDCWHMRFRNAGLINEED
ncbi:MAG: hypothetical protein OXC72_14470 [Roseovarius sp.]|nr:hypothetical protein [Roseovarius sp.]